MLFVKKYLLFVFLLENIMVQTSLMGSFANPLFYVFLALGLVCALDSRIWGGPAIKRFGWAYALMGLYVTYEFIIGSEYINPKTLLYLISRIVTFVIIISGITYNEEFYCTKAIKWLILTMSFFLLYGLATGNVTEASGRMDVGFTNANTTGSIGALIVGMLVFYLKDKKWNNLYYACLLAGMFGVLASGSRAGFLMMGLLVLMRYGVTIRPVAMGLTLVVFGLFILPAFGIETVGLQRLMDTYNGVEGTNRDVEREAAEWMIAQKPLTGWGFQAVNQGYAAIISKLASHNGYLEIIKQMGYPCAIVYFLIIVSYIFNAGVMIYKKRLAMNMYFAISLMCLLKANYESLFIGVHEFETNLFFFVLAMVSYKVYAIKYQVDN